jgi:predicted Zn-dependent protease
MTNYLIKVLVLIVTSIFLANCAQNTTKKGSVGVKRQQIMLVSSTEMKKGAVQAYSQVLAKAKKEGNLNPNKKQLQTLRTIANRLTSQTYVFRKDAPNWDWEVNIIKSKQLNAWCMPGGKIAFYTGIIEQLKLTNAEIAAIMGHEIAHALREHGRERASQAQMQGLGLAFLGVLTGAKSSTLNLTSLVMNVTMTLPNSREHEIEADRIGVELAARAGYDPFAAVSVWQKMKKISKGSPPEFLSTHPSNNSRIKDLKKYAKRVNHLYKK